MLRITGWEKSCVPVVNISWLIRNLKQRDTKRSIAQWKLSTKQSWTRILIIFSTIWNVQQKWIWLLASLWKIKKTEGSDIFKQTKTIPCWIDPNLCAPKATWQSWKSFSTQQTTDWAQSWQTWLYLLLYSNTCLWGVRTQSYPTFYWEIVQSTVSRMKKWKDNHITTTCASLVRLLSICMPLNDWKKKLQNCSIYSSINYLDWAPINSRESTWTKFRLLKIC